MDRCTNGYYLIFEAKNEVGKGQADVFMEAFSYHYHFNSKNLSLCPCFIMELVGPHMQIYGMIRDETFQADMLTMPLWLDYQPNNYEAMLHCAKVFKALKSAVIKLEQYYVSGKNVNQMFLVNFDVGIENVHRKNQKSFLLNKISR